MNNTIIYYYPHLKMSFAVISNVDFATKSNMGSKYVKTVISVSAETQNESVENYMKSALNINDVQTDKPLELSNDTYFLKYVSPFKYELYQCQHIPSTSWIWPAPIINNKLIGKISFVPFEVDSSNSETIKNIEKIEEMKQHVHNLNNEKRDILAKSCEFESQINALKVENTTLQVIIDRFNREIASIHNKRDEDQIALDNRLANLEKRHNPRIQVRPQNQKQILESARNVNTTTIDELRKFDRSKLRPTQMTASMIQ